MPTQEFALDASGVNRVQIFHGNDGTLTLLHNRSIIGTISNQEELATGREITLKDGISLKVQFVNGEVQVLRNGEPLTLMSTRTIAAAEEVARAKSEASAAEEAAVAEARARAALEARSAMTGSVKNNPSTSTSTFTSQQNLGWLVSGAGALLDLLAFFAMPYIMLGPISITAQQIASVGSKYGNQFSGLQLLWIEPLIAVILLIIAGVQLYRSTTPFYDGSGGL